MASKKSAYSVLKEMEKKLKDTEEKQQPIESDVVNQDKLRKRNLMSTPKQKQISDDIHTSPCFEKQKKGDTRLSSLRKSLRKKIKKESHHDVVLREGGKENKLTKAGSYLQVFGSSNWTESLQSLNSSCLEEAFLPEVVKQKKEQKKLHEENINSKKDQLRSSSASELSQKSSETRKRSISYTHSSLEKPPVPKKIKSTTSEEKSKTKETNHHNSRYEGPDEELIGAEKLFAWIVSPINPDQFFSTVWQKKPLFLKRRQPKYNDVWFSSKELDRILRHQCVKFTKNLDIAVYRNGKRETLNPEGRAFAPVVWKFYQEGCSIRLLNPQTFSKKIWQLTSKLQEHFGCFVGSNIYLTPAGAQGFAPHYDDIEAFIIQLEGKKHWRLYSSRNLSEVLPRQSSENLSQEELGEPILDRVLEPGDTLYFPRGVIHQASTSDDTHSLHITLSVCQKACWSDFMEKLVPMALQTAIEEDVEFRKALPLGYHQHTGVSYSEKSTSERKAFVKTVEQLMRKLASYVSVDQAVDELVLDQMEEFLPPCLSSEEVNATIYGNGAFWDSGQVRGASELSLNSDIRLLRPGIVRLVSVDDALEIHHTLDNSRQYKERAMESIRVPLNLADAVEYVLLSYPDYVKVKDIPLSDKDEKLALASKFYNAGIIRTKTPLFQDLLI